MIKNQYNEPKSMMMAILKTVDTQDEELVKMRQKLQASSGGGQQLIDVAELGKMLSVTCNHLESFSQPQDFFDYKK